MLPFVPLMRDAEEQVARLVELHADDAATRARDPRLLATALVVLATAASPAPALAAGATDSVQRIHRLLGPAEPLGRARRQLLRAAAAALALTPVLLALTPAVIALALGQASGRVARHRRLNTLPAHPVLAGMRMHRQNGLPGRPPGREDNTADHRSGASAGEHAAAGTAAPGKRPARARIQTTVQAPASPGCRRRAQARPARPMARRDPGAPGEIVAAAMQLAIALLTAGLDSPELEAWAADALTPVDAEGLGDLIAGLHVISVLLLHELHEATGEPSAAILQRLAILAETGRGTPPATKAPSPAGAVDRPAAAGI